MESVALNVKEGGISLPAPVERVDPLVKATITPGTQDL